MPTPPTPPTHWWLTVRIDACRTRDERVAAASGDDAVRMWRALHPNLEVIHVRPVPELVDIELEHMSTNNNNNNTDPIRGVPPLLAARAALAAPERVAPKSIEERIAEADAAIEASMKRIRKIIATPARLLAAEANRSAVPVATPAGPTDEEIIAFWSEHCAGDGDAGIIRLARWGHQPAPPAEGEVAEPVADGPAVPEGREPAAVVREPSDEELDAMERQCYLATEVCNDSGCEYVLEHRRYARAVLARFGNHSPDATKMVSDAYQMGRRDASADSQQAAEAAEDEVVDEVRYVVYELRDQADEMSPSLELFGLIHRAADLLEQRHPAPVPVAERLPGPEDCDGEGRCWLHLPDMGTEPLWRLTDPSMRSRYHSHWLPANALPLPKGEVK